MRPCRNVEEIVKEVNHIIDDDMKSSSDEPGATYFFRGESHNWDTKDNSNVGTKFSPSLYRKDNWIKNERKLYEEAVRLNIVSFEQDRTMSERLARMQHYQLPTRFADISNNALLATFFASDDNEKKLDGFVRIIKVADHKMKSFTSDIIRAISHLPLVNFENINPSKDDGVGYLTFELKSERHGFFSETEWPELGEQLRRDIQHVWAFLPIYNSPRIQKQGGAFLAFGCGDNKSKLDATFAPKDYNNKNTPSYGIKQIDAVRIASDAKETIKEQLRRFGMPAEGVYPELSEVCKELQKRFGK